ncbi:MAG: hypothetical protein R6V83_07025 [Candidatus Thorarchaeota archaeon]
MENEQRSDFRPEPLDLVIAIIAAFGLPIFSGYLYATMGALPVLVIYYGVFCIGLRKWRYGNLGYKLEKGSIIEQFKGYTTKPFIIALVAQIGLVIDSWIVVEHVTNSTLLGFLGTLLLWAPINAFSEQLSWLYVFESFSEFSDEKTKRRIGTAIGILLYVAYIGLIHALFWGRFLLGSVIISPFTEIFFILQFVVSLCYLAIYRQSRSMWPIGLIHFLLNFTSVLFSGYSMVPYLIR